jgi:octaprenyl-diphosphate synthase
MELIKKYRGIEYSIKKARSYAQAAKQALNGFAPTPEKQALITVADYVVERRN